MHLRPWAAFACVPALIGCGGASKTPLAPVGVTEAQAVRGGGTRAPSTEAHRSPFEANVWQAASHNDAYRRVLFTGAKTQLVVMTINPGDDIGIETHPNVEQLVFVASGQGKAILDGAASVLGAGDVLVITPGTTHDVINTGKGPLRIYTIYSPPNHIDGRVHRFKSDAEADKADEAFGRAVR